MPSIYKTTLTVYQDGEVSMKSKIVTYSKEFYILGNKKCSFTYYYVVLIGQCHLPVGDTL